jgi:hypothetical protein
MILKLEKTIKNKAIPATGRGGPYGCEASMIPYFLDNRLRWRLGFQAYAPAGLYPQEYS